mmetsp:Transcript_7987/g.23405  ORF Transcript_7987/g.23405 Transcript_7987/m.23405 type:complete len:417 (+) Transcript_7987:930-2180(+)
MPRCRPSARSASARSGSETTTTTSTATLSGGGRRCGRRCARRRRARRGVRAVRAASPAGGAAGPAAPRPSARVWRPPSARPPPRFHQGPGRDDRRVPVAVPLDVHDQGRTAAHHLYDWRRPAAPVHQGQGRGPRPGARIRLHHPGLWERHRVRLAARGAAAAGQAARALDEHKGARGDGAKDDRRGGGVLSRVGQRGRGRDPEGLLGAHHHDRVVVPHGPRDPREPLLRDRAHLPRPRRRPHAALDAVARRPHPEAQGARRGARRDGCNLLQDHCQPAERRRAVGRLSAEDHRLSVQGRGGREREGGQGGARLHRLGGDWVAHRPPLRGAAHLLHHRHLARRHAPLQQRGDGRLPGGAAGASAGRGVADVRQPARDGLHAPRHHRDAAPLPAAHPADAAGDARRRPAGGRAHHPER